MAKIQFEEGDKILIELHGGRSVQSDFIRESTDGIIVKNSKEGSKILKWNQTFYNIEIKSVRLIKKVQVKSKVNENETKTTSEEIQNENELQTTSQHVQCNNNAIEERTAPTLQRIITKKQFTEPEIETIQERTRNTVQIAQHDDKYHNAIKDLKQQEIISVHSESTFGRLDISRPLLTLATTTSVYMFDMLRLGAMKKEMKELFSSELPRKIVHSSSALADYLLHKEKCTLNHVFDTLLVHFNITKSREHITLQKCYSTYFELPDNFVLKDQDYMIRPLPKEAVIRAALNGILLMKMYWHMNDILMKPVYIASKQFSQIYPNVEHQVDLMMNMNHKVHPGVENIELNAVEYMNDKLNMLDVNGVNDVNDN